MMRWLGFLMSAFLSYSAVATHVHPSNINYVCYRSPHSDGGSSSYLYSYRFMIELVPNETGYSSQWSQMFDVVKTAEEDSAVRGRCEREASRIRRALDYVSRSRRISFCNIWGGMIILNLDPTPVSAPQHTAVTLNSVVSGGADYASCATKSNDFNSSEDH